MLSRFRYSAEVHLSLRTGKASLFKVAMIPRQQRRSCRQWLQRGLCARSSSFFCMIFFGKSVSIFPDHTADNKKPRTSYRAGLRIR